MFLSELKSKSKSILNLWMFLFALQAAFVIISAIVMSHMVVHNSGSWIWEYLTLTQGDGGVAWIWLVCNGSITALDFALSFRVHKENRLVLNKTHSTSETIILRKMYRNLKYALILMIIALFAQVVHGFIWWVVGAAAVFCKVCYVRELIHLDPKLYSFRLPFRSQSQEQED